ncbi:MAG: B12-binding domain-containing radical SAM protein [Planctomycetota bacterium]|jgi:radical SAM superfamily enzyme YgiQ (UPF0313 family)
MAESINILLIHPRWSGLFYRRKIKINEQKIHPLGLAVVAASSGNHNIKIVDEAIENIPTDVSAYDLIGITVDTFTSLRAYRIADGLRKEKKTVVFGGVHTSMMPDECLKHADSIVVGDAEDTWPVLLEDFMSNRIKRKYISSNEVSGKRIPGPRRDLFKKMNRKVAYCQVSRGCNHQCRFCYLQYMPSRTLRARDIQDVYYELKSMKENIILFVDDNLFGDRDYAIELFKKITPLNKKWWIQAPTTLYEDEELISVLASSGCFSLCIGFQTTSNSVNKDELILQNNVNDYKRLVELLHKYGILVDGTFIFGFDGDSNDVFGDTEELIRHLELDTYIFYFLTPYPGTKYYDYFLNEGRILHKDWSLFDWDHVVVKPRNMTERELLEGVENLYRRLDRSYFVQHVMKNPGRYRKVLSKDLFPFLIPLGWHYRTSRISRL